MVERSRESLAVLRLLAPGCGTARGPQGTLGHWQRYGRTTINQAASLHAREERNHNVAHGNRTVTGSVNECES